MTRESFVAIKNDPQASEEEVVWLCGVDPIAALQHPNCPRLLWWDLAAEHPLEARASPLWQLFLLEAPGQWQTLVRERIDQWIAADIVAMTQQQRHLFAADCAERVLYIYEEDMPGDDRPRKAVEARRRHGHQELGMSNQTSWELELAMQAATDAHQELKLPLGHPVRNAARATCLFNEGQVASAASWAAGHGYHSNEVVRAEKERRFAELLWQWSRAQQYLKGEAP